MPKVVRFDSYHLWSHEKLTKRVFKMFSTEIRSPSIYFYERIIVDWDTQHTIKQKKQSIPHLLSFPICYLFLLLMVIAFSDDEALDRAPTRSLLGMWGFEFQETTWACPDLNEAPPAMSLSYHEGNYLCVNILLSDNHFVLTLSSVLIFYGV